MLWLARSIFAQHPSSGWDMTIPKEKSADERRNAVFLRMLKTKPDGNTATLKLPAKDVRRATSSKPDKNRQNPIPRKCSHRNTKKRVTKTTRFLLRFRRKCRN